MKVFFKKNWRMFIAIASVLFSILMGYFDMQKYAPQDYEFFRERIGEWMKMVGWAGIVYWIFSGFSDILARKVWIPIVIYYVAMFAYIDDGLLHQLAFPLLACVSAYAIHMYLKSKSND